MFRILLLGILMFATGLQASRITESVVRIEATALQPNYKTPWNPGDVISGAGTGFVIAGNRIMTNAHVVGNARFLTVSKEGDPQPWIARVAHVAHDCDLALLEVERAEFFSGTSPLEFGGIPAIESMVSVYGYPIGGTRLSVTRGIVSRIDFQTYSHSGMDAHLAVQIDAAINPGNSGGPVMQAGKVVGVAFQGFRGDVAQNVGYMIPTPVVERFLKDVEDGRYDRYVDLALTYETLFNPAARKALGLADDNRGVVVSSVYATGSSDGVVEPGDVLLKIDGLDISSDGTIPIDANGPVPLTEVVERKFKGDSVELEVLRGGKRKTLVVPLHSPWPFTLQASAYDEKPRFVVFGGLVFQPVDWNFMEAHEPGDQRLNYMFDYFVEDGIHKTMKEPVVIGSILPDPVNSYAGDFLHSPVESINGVRIRSIDDVAAAFANPVDYHVISLHGDQRPIVLERELVEQARPRILERYGVTSEQNLEK